MRQYLGCEFKPGGRLYTYHNDGEPAAEGDEVLVNTSRGMQSVTVIEAHHRKPPFATKPIIGGEGAESAPEAPTEPA